MSILASDSNSGWSLPRNEDGDIVVQKDTVIEYTENYRSIGTVGGRKVFQKKIDDSPKGIDVQEYRGRFNIAVEVDEASIPDDMRNEIHPQKDSRRERQRVSFHYVPGGNKINSIRVDFTEVTTDIDGKEDTRSRSRSKR